MIKKTEKKTVKSVNADIVRDISSMFIACLEKGEIPWRKPWNSSKSGYVSGQTGKHYGLVNTLMLTLRGHEAGEFVTLKQIMDRTQTDKPKVWDYFIKDENGNIPKSSKVYYRSMIVYDKKDENGKPILDENGNKVQGKYFLLKSSNVWRVGSQVKIEPKYAKEPEKSAVNQNFEADKLLMDYSAREKIEIRERDTGRAYYSVTEDFISLPPKDMFPDTADFYQVAFHETVHSTGAENRLNRFSKTSTPTESKQEYSFEELVAEIGSNILLHDNGWDNEKIDNRSQAYIQGWISYLKKSPETIEKACSYATKATEYIYGNK